MSVILISGANKGIGFEMARQLARLSHQVIVTARDPERGQEAAKTLQAEKLPVYFLPLDITDGGSIEDAAESVRAKFGKLDVLINNAAILMKEDQSLLRNEWSLIEQTINTDATAHLNVIRKFLPLMSAGSKIIMTSSEGGSMTDPVGGWSPAYCISKSLLNAITRHLAHELESAGITVNAFCPGWVKTDMGGMSASRSVEKGAETGVWLATSENTGTGKFFRDRKVIPW
jgi:NAD(P)-dependent dehydrogenase (short-subunit alcohol dehydrogenase family)